MLISVLAAPEPLHISPAARIALTVLRGSTNFSPSSSSLGPPDPVSILCSFSSPMSGCVSGLNTSSNSLVHFFFSAE